jgi:hypothetical protein
MRALSFLFLIGTTALAQPQTKESALPYSEIPDYPKTYTATTVAARLIDGLGFRYYWATEGLRDEDLAYAPNNDSRTALETLTHIYDLSTIIINSVNEMPTEFGEETPALTFEKMRKQTLFNLKSASDKLKASKDTDLEKYNMVFQRGTNKSVFPFWNEINGPISDALWHVGQVVSFRRSSGNPFNAKVSVLTGAVRE